MIATCHSLFAKHACLAFLVTFVLFPSSGMAQGSNWKEVWDQTVAAANKEGQLIISGPSGTAWREQLLKFQEEYPGIKLSITAAASRDFWPRVIKEREAKLNLWDLRVGGPDNLVY